MGFVIEISEVGEPEYPLLETLRESIFADEFGHVSRTPVAESLADRRDLLVLIAHLEGNPVGFGAGYLRDPGTYYLNYLAILRDYRGQGLGRQMLQRHEDFARSRQYRQVQFDTHNHFAGMIRLGLANSYRVVGVEQGERTNYDLAIRFAKLLAPVTNGGVTAPPPASSETHVAADDSRALLDAVERGRGISGLVRDPNDGRLYVVVQSAPR